MKINIWAGLSRIFAAVWKAAHIILVFLFVLTAFGTIYNFSSVSLGREQDRKALFLIGIVLTVLLTGVFVVIFRWIDRMKMRKGQYILSASLFAIMIAFFIVLLTQFDVKPKTDSLYDIDAGLYFLDHDRATYDSGLNGYMLKCANNYTFSILLSYFFRMLMSLGITDVLFPLYIANVMAILLAVVLLYMIVKEMLGIRAANKTLLLCTLNPIYYGLTFWSYTTTFSLPVMMGVMLFAIRCYKAKKIWSEILFAVGEGLLLVLGYEIRPTAIFPFVAIVLFTVGILRKHQILRKVLRSGICIVCTICVAMVLWSNVKNSYFSEVSKGAFPISYYFMMGSHGNGDLTTIGNDLNLMNAYETTEEKSEVAWEKTFENYKQLGISGTVNLWYRKLVSTFSDGYSNITTRVDAGQTESSMYEWFAGNRRGLFQLYAQAFRLITIFGACIVVLRSIRSSRTPAFLSILCITVLGGMLFHMVWEAKNIYSAPFLLCLFPVTQDGLSKYETEGMKKSIISRIDKSIKGRIVFAGFTIFTCLNLLSMFAQESSFDYYRINNLFPNYVAKIESDMYIQQDFYVEKSFNQIIFQVKKAAGEASYSTYDVSVSDDSGKILGQTVVSAKDIKDDHLTARFPEEISGETHYTLQIWKQDPSQNSISFFTRNTLYLDAYDGSMLVDGNDTYVSDLVMAVLLHSDKEMYFSKVTRGVIVLVILILAAVVCFERPIYERIQKSIKATAPSEE